MFDTLIKIINGALKIFLNLFISQIESGAASRFKEYLDNTQAFDSTPV